jgi:hypothetical protein
VTQVRRQRGVNRVGGVIGRFGPNGESGVWPVHSLASDPYYDNVSLLLHMDGTDGSTTFTDSSKNAFSVTANGNAQIDDAQSKFGGAAALFDGNGDFLSIANDAALGLASGDCTIEAWVYWSGSNSTGTVLDKDGQAGSFNPQYNISLNNASRLAVYLGPTSLQTLTSNTNLPTSTWVHIAFVRNGTRVALYQGGAVVASATQTATMSNATRALRIGHQANTGTASYWNGSIDELRITKACRYQSAFTPPTRPFLP